MTTKKQVKTMVQIKTSQERRFWRIADKTAEASPAITHDENLPTIFANGAGMFGSWHSRIQAKIKNIVTEYNRARNKSAKVISGPLPSSVIGGYLRLQVTDSTIHRKTQIQFLVLAGLLDCWTAPICGMNFTLLFRERKYLGGFLLSLRGRGSSNSVPARLTLYLNLFSVKLRATLYAPLQQK
jgi:hypothetical protein